MKPTTAVLSVRLVVNVAVFALFLGAIAAFLLKQVPGRLEVDRAVVVAIVGGVWAGTLVTLVEVRVHPIESLGRRLVLAGLVGAATYGGLVVAIASLRVLPVRPEMLAVVSIFGALVHALRAAKRVDRQDDKDADDDGDDDDDGNDGNDGNDGKAT